MTKTQGVYTNTSGKKIVMERNILEFLSSSFQGIEIGKEYE